MRERIYIILILTGICRSGFDDNWGLEDPTGKSDEEFKTVINEIEKRILQLREELRATNEQVKME